MRAQARAWRTALAALLIGTGALTGSAVAGAAGATVPGRPASFDYALTPQRLADGVYVLIGRTEDFSVANGGNIVNIGFLVGSTGVTVIDSGPSRRYGEQLQAAIARVTDLPVVQVINTHHHPDHVMGNHAFARPLLAALPVTREALAAEGEDFLDNMYRLTGDWMRDTALRLPDVTLAEGEHTPGGRRLTLIAALGHTVGDLAVLDRDSGVLFAGDLVFHDRAPTTPHADLDRWLAALDRLEGLPFTRLVPGHGPVADDAAPIAQTRDYLQWLGATMARAAEEGLQMNEVLQQPLPARFARLALVDNEYRRSVVHLFPKAERKALGREH